MPQKSVSDLIFDKFAKNVEGDALFQGISVELSNAVRAEKRKKAEIISILKKENDEDSGTGN